uniref:Uncharacterized protein n=1 Tax=Tanacetum cinerariifolium TaxID=118510 RepID=A0A6L2JRD3_TANCI|nr:hypothetical protein [Tanacetum cinerariifolium]
MSGTVPPIPPPLGTSSGNPSSPNVNRVDRMPTTTDHINAMTTINALSSKALISNNHFQDSDSVVEEDQRTSNEFMVDLNVEYHERVLLVNLEKDFPSNKTSTPSYPSSNNSFNKPKPYTPSFNQTSSQNTCNYQKDYKGKYKGLKAEMVVHTKRIDDLTKGNKDEGTTMIREFMAIAKDEPSVGKADARYGQWVDITMKKRKNLVNKINLLKQEMSLHKSELCNLKNTMSINCSLQNEVVRFNLENESLKDEISDLKKALGGRGKRKEKISSKEVIFTKADESSSLSILEITSDSESECKTREPLLPLPKLKRATPTVIKRKTGNKLPTIPESGSDKKADSSTEQLLLTLIEELTVLKSTPTTGDRGLLTSNPQNPLKSGFTKGTNLCENVCARLPKEDSVTPKDPPEFTKAGDHLAFNKLDQPESADILKSAETQNNVIIEPIIKVSILVVLDLSKITVPYKLREFDPFRAWDQQVAIDKGNTLPKTHLMKGVEIVTPINFIKDKAQRRLEVKARSTLMMGIPNEHQLKFNSIKDAKLLLEAVEKRNKPDLESMSMDDLCNNLKDLEQIHPDDIEEMDLRWQMAILTIRARRFLKNTGRKLTVNGNKTIGFDKIRVECYNCHKRGHFVRECRAPISQDNMNRESTRRNIPVETTNSSALVSCDGKFMPPKPDLSFIGLKEFSVEHVVENKAKDNEEKPKNVRENNGALIIEDWESDDEKETMSQPKVEKETVKPSVVKNEFVKPKQQKKIARKTIKQVEKTKQNSHKPRGNKRNWNDMMSYRLGSNFEMFNKACYGKIVNAARSTTVVNTARSKAVVNTASSKAVVNVVQGKMLMLLRPQHVGIKELLIVDAQGTRQGTCPILLIMKKLIEDMLPLESLMKKMYCLVVTDDYSRFTWGFFLATKDETSDILKSFITRIENLINHKVKVIRCDNKTEFKNREMNQFCKMKGIIRHYSVARTPQPNGYAEKRTRTLIEAAKTMLVDSKLPTTFWAKAVSTACYVQNRVLVVKPHNMTPYELFYGRTPALSFMRPFGCPVTILNTIDHLGNNASKARKKNEPVKNYILLPLWTADPLFSQDPKIPKSSQDDGFKPSNDVGKKDNKGDLKKDDQEKDDSVNSTNRVNTVSSTFNTASTSGVNAVDKNIINELLDDPNMPKFEDISIFEDSHEDVGAEADLHNLESTFQVSPIPTTKVHKDHPLDQVIGDMQSVIQTRRMSKNLEEHGFEGNSSFKGSKLDRSYARRASTVQATKGIDYDEVFSPVARIEAIRLFLAYALFKDFVVYQMDVKSDFLYGKIKEEVYVCQPPRFEDPNFLNKVYKVEKTLYGLHQAPRAWYETLSTYLLDNGFQRGKIDKTLFIRRHNGLQVKQKKDDIFISQDKYVARILKKFGFSEVKTASTPMETQKPLLKDKDGEEVDVHMYRSMIDSFLTSSRPDIMFAVYTCARYQVNHKVSYLHAVKRNLSDYAGASLDRKSTTGGCQFLGCRLILWQCKKQTVVANSTTKAEYVADSSCCGQTFLDTQLNGLPTHKEKYDVPSHTKKVFANKKRIGKGFLGKETPLFLTMVGPNQVAMGEDIVADEAVYKEGDGSLVRAATTASSLEAKQVSGGNTPRSDEDRMKLNELIDICTTLTQRVLDLETELKETKATHKAEVVDLRKRVKKLEKKHKSRTHKLKRLYKVGLSARVESSTDDRSLDKEDASKQGRMNIDDIDADDNITLVSAQDEVNVDEGIENVIEEEVVEDIITAKLITEVVSVAGDELNAASRPSTPVSATTPTITTAPTTTEATKTNVEITTASKVRGVTIHKQDESTTIKLISSQQPRVKDKSKGKEKMTEPEPVKSLKKRTLEQIRMDEELDAKLEAEIQAEFQEEEMIAREKAQQEVEANESLINTWDDIQAKINADA